MTRNEALQLTRSGAVLRGVDFTGTDLSGANFANCYGAILRGVDLTNADLTAVNLTNANLRGTNFTNANFTKANCYDTNFTNANFTNANCYGTNFAAANFTGANLSNAILTGCNLWNTKGNGREIKNIVTPTYPVTYTRDRLQIGCRNHAIADWWVFTYDDIGEMDNGALEYWREHKDLLRATITSEPAI